MPAPLSRFAAASLRATTLLLPMLLAACAAPSDRPGLTDSLRPYRADVVQGNFVSQQQAQALHPGMTKEQVRSLLGTPLLQDMFHGERWEYVFSLRQGYQQPLVRRFTVAFDKDGRLASTQGDPLPSEDQFVAQINTLRSRSNPKTLSQDQLQARIDAAQAQRGTAPAAAASAAGPLTLLAPPAAIKQLEPYAPTQP